VTGSDKTEAPTPKRKREARRDGRIARSPELSTWGAALLASFVLPMGLARAGAAVDDVFRRTAAVVARPDRAEALGLVGAGGRAVVTGVVPLALAMAAFAVVANLAQGGLVVSSKRLKPSTERLNPVKGFKRLFSVESAWNALKVLVRTTVLAGAAWLPLRAALARLGSTELPPLRTLLAQVGAQALDMVRLLETRTESGDMKLLALRIKVSQSDEIKFMQGWLRDRGESVPGEHAHHAHDFTRMPGMLSPGDMKTLEAAKGREFDRLFLEYMIKHHEGALVMVDELFRQDGAGQEAMIHAFASDVVADQQMEITRMIAMWRGMQR